MSLARVQFFSLSLDGFGTGDVQSHDAPFGHAGDRLHEWMFTTRWWHPMVGEAGGRRGLDDAGRVALRAACAELLPPAPIDVEATAWAVRASVA